MTLRHSLTASLASEQVLMIFGAETLVAGSRHDQLADEVFYYDATRKRWDRVAMAPGTVHCSAFTAASLHCEVYLTGDGFVGTCVDVTVTWFDVVRCAQVGLRRTSRPVRFGFSTLTSTSGSGRRRSSPRVTTTPVSPLTTSSTCSVSAVAPSAGSDE